MKDERRAKEDVIKELAELRRRVAELKESESRHKLLTEALYESTERFRAVFETAQDCIFLKDRDLKYILVNPTFEKIFGLPASKLIGLTDKDLFGLEIAKRIWEEDARVLAGESLEVEHAKPVNGVINTFDIIRVPLFNGAGSVTGICGIARNITERKKVEESLKESSKKLRSLTVHLQTLQEKERRRIAGDIHDEFGQVFTALNYDLAWMRKKLPADQRDLIEMTEKMSRLIDNGIRTVQKISSELRPALLDELGLAPAIEWHAKEYEKRTGICCNVEVAAEENILDKDLSTAFFRVFQEALTNVARHANATNVNITLKESEGKLFLKITDDGRGITKKEISSPKAFGLTGIKERFYPWEGEVRITGARGKGTEITVCVPFDKDRKKERL